jgi:hypothetical protein
LDEESDRVETTNDGDEAPQISKNARKKRKRRGIDGQALSVYKDNSTSNDDVSDPPRVSADSKEEEDPKNPKPKGNTKKKRTPKDSKFFGIKPSLIEVAEVKEYLDLAQNLFTGVPLEIAIMMPDGQIAKRSTAVSDFKTSVYEMTEAGTIVKNECTFAYKFAKLNAVTTGGVVGKFEDYCENHPVVASLVTGVFTAYSFSKELQKLEAMLKANSRAPAQSPQGNPESNQNPPINNNNEDIKVSPVES